MEWKEEYSVGIHEMDVQHQALARCIALVEKAVATKQQFSTVQSALAQLADVVRIHFAVEENLMRTHGYSECERHADEHVKFTDQLRQLREKSLRGEASEEMVANLAKWLRLHITVSDEHYAAHFPTAEIVNEGPIRGNVTGLEPACGAEYSGVAVGCILAAELALATAIALCSTWLQ
jgi:hemerythrin